jgi:hypothetical protein
VDLWFRQNIIDGQGYRHLGRFECRANEAAALVSQPFFGEFGRFQFGIQNLVEDGLVGNTLVKVVLAIEDLANLYGNFLIHEHELLELWLEEA